MDNAVVIPLIGAIVSLAGVIVWAVRFMLRKMFGTNGNEGAWGRMLSKLDELKDSVNALRLEQHKVLERLDRMAP